MEETLYHSVNLNATTPLSHSCPESIFGTADRLIWREKPRHLDLVDFKFGYGEIDEAEINVQGIAYGLGGIDMYPTAKTLTVHFLIPRRDEVLTHTFTREELEGQRLRIKLIIERALLYEPDLSPNTESCKYCGVRAKCSALANKLLPIAKKYASTAEAFEVSLYKEMNPANIEDPDMLNKMMQVAAVVDNWGSAVKKESLRRAVEEGVEYSDFDLHHRRPSFTFKGEEMIALFDAASHLLNDDELARTCKTSINELAKALAAKLPRGEKGTARGTIESILLQAGLIPEDDEVHTTPYLRRKRNLK
jgi:hypothetical protein